MSLERLVHFELNLNLVRFIETSVILSRYGLINEVHKKYLNRSENQNPKLWGIFQWTFKRAMLGISLRNRKRNEWIWTKNWIERCYPWVTVAEIDRTWIENKRWTKFILDWKSYNYTQPVWKPPVKWIDEIKWPLISERHTTEENLQKMSTNRET